MKIQQTKITVAKKVVFFVMAICGIKTICFNILENHILDEKLDATVIFDKKVRTEAPLEGVKITVAKKYI